MNPERSALSAVPFTTRSRHSPQCRLLFTQSSASLEPIADVCAIESLGVGLDRYRAGCARSPSRRQLEPRSLAAPPSFTRRSSSSSPHRNRAGLGPCRQSSVAAEAREDPGRVRDELQRASRSSIAGSRSASDNSDPTRAIFQQPRHAHIYRRPTKRGCLQVPIRAEVTRFGEYHT